MKKIITTIFSCFSVLVLFATGHTVTITPNNVPCKGMNNGSAIASVSGGIGPFSYSWSNAATGITNANIVAGSYTCTVTDNNDLSTATASVIITEPAALIVSTTSTSACGTANGTATALVSGGVGPYMYLWSHSANTATTSGLSSGAYYVTVTDANGCAATDVVTVNNIPGIVAATTVIQNVSCGGSNNGAASATASGGTTPYSYLWSHAFTLANAGNLIAGTYSVTVTDVNGCASLSTVTITEPPKLIVSVTSSNTTCGLSNGTATASASGGTPGYSYSWAITGHFTPTSTGMAAGTYTVTVTDVVGCTGTTTALINISPSILITLTKSDASCGQNNGSAIATASGGTGALTYTWSIGSTLITASNLAAGSYTVTVTDGSGCTGTSIAVISNTGAPTVGITTKNASCQAVLDGKAGATASGGVTPYTYLWNTGSVNDTLFNLAKGAYILTVTDGNGCKSVTLVNIGVPGGGIHFNIKQLLYNNCGLCNAKVKIYDLAGGISPYTYKWSGSGLSADSANALCAGAYSLTVTDNAGCSAEGNVYIGGYNGNVLTGRVYNDKNKNCVYDAGDDPWKGGIVYTYNSKSALTDSNGVYTIYNIPTGNTNLTLNFNASKWTKYNCPSIGYYSVNFPASCDTISNKDFALSFPSNVQELRATLYTGTARPGFQQSNTVCYYNEGTKIMNGIVRVTHDTDLVFISSTPVQASYIKPVLEWNFTNFAPGASSCITFITEIPSTKPIGTQLITKAEVFPIVGDTATDDNTVIDTRLVQGSYDPNLKEVQPTGNILPSDTILKYTLHFQNTGNDTAFNITVKDTLPVYLNPATIKIGASSHKCRVELFNNVLVFVFPNILLVDSLRNEPKSHGWVNFTIHTKTGTLVGTSIENEADIYFDFNAPITTNKVVSKVTLVGVPIVNNNSSEFSIYPNPAADKLYLLYKATNTTFKPLNVELFNIMGSKVRTQQNIKPGANEISLEGLSHGLYLLQIKDAENKIISVERVVVE